MMDILFVVGFFVMLLLVGITLPAIIAALIVATALMVLGGMLAFVVKMLPWLLLAVVAVGLYRHFRKTPSKYSARLSR
ncbi:envelope stress response protein PspG [Erwinia psidii]|uniref:Envelope stress response protein PspG n=2 Tax=Erwinia psidii TaxID=69224 RepID=A0A3N6UKP3_9GAMM|nr:envelope stress response protein PspG [Erwinia psidii]MCX8965950.1 envelope stress response protein PspG [Erwinia psidii]RQM36509.1 envelope stress response protein PspG [Erwinia psidii]